MNVTPGLLVQAMKRLRNDTENPKEELQKILNEIFMERLERNERIKNTYKKEMKKKKLGKISRRKNRSK